MHSVLDRISGIASLGVGITAWVLTLPWMLLGFVAFGTMFVFALSSGKFFGSFVSVVVTGAIGLRGLYDSYRSCGKSYDAISRSVSYLLVGTIFALLLSVAFSALAFVSEAVTMQVVVLGTPGVGFALLAAYGAMRIGRMRVDTSANHQDRDPMTSESVLLALGLTLLLLLIGFSNIY